MKAKEIRQVSVNELKQMIVKLLKNQFVLRMKKGMGEKPKPHEIKQNRRRIARIKTIINEKERQA